MRRPSPRSRSLVCRSLVWKRRFALAPALALACFAAPAAFARQADPADPPAAPDNASPDASSDEGPKTGPPLPRGLQPPPTKPDSFITVTPLLTEQKLKDLRFDVNQARYRDVLEDGPTDANRRTVIENWAKWRVAQMTGPAPTPDADDEPRPMVADRFALKKLVDDLIREANRNVGPVGGGRAAEDVKLKVFPILAAELARLKDNHLVLRTQAIKILAELEINSARPGQPFKRFGPGIAQLLEFYRTAGESQPELAVKYQAAGALAFVAENGRDVPGKVQFDAANLFAADLAAHPEYPGWMQGGLASAVARMNLREPTLARNLLTAVTDESRPYEARTRAAAAIVRLPGVPGDVRDALPGALEDLGRSMALSYNARPAAEYVENFRTLEFAFKPIAPSERNRLQGRGAILEGDSVAAGFQAAYGRLHPLVKHVANQNLAASPAKWTPIPDALLTNAGVDAS